MKKSIIFFLIVIVSIIMLCCNANVSKPDNYKVEIIREIEHKGDRIFTQGFEIYNGKLYESTGLRGESCIKIINIENGDIIKQVNLEEAVSEGSYFGEGITIYNDEIIQLTWKGGKAFSYSTDLTLQDKIFTYNTEGWGLTHNDKYYIMSDGSKYLYFRDFDTFDIINKLYVGTEYLNELEYADGIIYANVWTKKYILMIDELTGEKIGKIDMSDLLCCKLSNKDHNAVLNGIAYNPDSDTFYITGKNCPFIYEVRLIKE